MQSNFKRMCSRVQPPHEAAGLAGSADSHSSLLAPHTPTRT